MCFFTKTNQLVNTKPVSGFPGALDNMVKGCLVCLRTRFVWRNKVAKFLLFMGSFLSS